MFEGGPYYFYSPCRLLVHRKCRESVSREEKEF